MQISTTEYRRSSSVKAARWVRKAELNGKTFYVSERGSVAVEVGNIFVSFPLQVAVALTGPDLANFLADRSVSEVTSQVSEKIQARNRRHEFFSSQYKKYTGLGLSHEQAELLAKQDSKNYNKI